MLWQSVLAPTQVGQLAPCLSSSLRVLGWDVPERWASAMDQELARVCSSRQALRHPGHCWQCHPESNASICTPWVRGKNGAKCCVTGLPVVGEIEAPGYLEGGDFFPAGRDLALIGIGLRSNFEACHQLMERDMLGTRRLAVVKDQFEQHQVCLIAPLLQHLMRCKALPSRASLMPGRHSLMEQDFGLDVC